MICKGRNKNEGGSLILLESLYNLLCFLGILHRLFPISPSRGTMSKQQIDVMGHGRARSWRVGRLGGDVVGGGISA
jgi:hypothetical protein